VVIRRTQGAHVARNIGSDVRLTTTAATNKYFLIKRANRLADIIISYARNGIETHRAIFAPVSIRVSNISARRAILINVNPRFLVLFSSPNVLLRQIYTARVSRSSHARATPVHANRLEKPFRERPRVIIIIRPRASFGFSQIERARSRHVFIRFVVFTNKNIRAHIY